MCLPYFITEETMKKFSYYRAIQFLMIFLVFGLLMGKGMWLFALGYLSIIMFLMDIRGLLLYPEKAKEELGA
jgi:hypothetical protein